MTMYLDKLGEWFKNRSMTIKESFYTAVGANSEYAFSGIFWTSMKDAEFYIKTVKEGCETYPYKSFLLIGLNMEITKSLASYLVEKAEIDPDKLFCYSLLENVYIKYATNETAVFTDVFETGEADECERIDSVESDPTESITPESIAPESNMTVEECVEVEEKTERNDEEPVEEPVAESVEISHSVEREVSEVAATKELFVPEENDTKTDVEIDTEEIQSNVYQMIANKRIYCATAYLYALSGSNALVKTTYEQLAYAVNDPAMRCSYNSQKIFSLYSEFVNYLMLSAGMRNFFMSHTDYYYDYQMKPLYDNMSAVPFAGESTSLLGAAYDMLGFKEKFHKGIDFYADYRLKDQNEVKRKLNELAVNAKTFYDSYVCGQPKNHKSVKRFVDTWKLIFSENGDLALYLNVVQEQDYSSAGDVQEYLLKNFISDNCSAEYSNLSMDKLNRYIDECWDKSKTNGGSRFKSTSLMSDLRNNLINAIEKVIRLLCEWSSLVNDKNISVDDVGAKRYSEIQQKLISELEVAIDEMQKRAENASEQEQAGAVVLENTLRELIARLDGSYDERSYKYYYIDFLRERYVLLDENYLPDMQGKFVDFQELSMLNRILSHSKAKLMTFREMLDMIFISYGDDYGSAKLIMDYLEVYGDTSYIDSYNIKVSQEQAQKEAAIKLKNFIENLELAQSYGQIEENKENKKEKIQRIANEWFEYANKTKNYGFFKMILEQYEKKIHEEAKVRGETLMKEIESIKNQSSANANRQKRIEKIQEMIDCQNYTVAEDLLSRIDSDESDEEVEYERQDYLQKFIDDYDYNYRMVANAGIALSKMVSARIHNKDDKGAKRLMIIG